MTTFTNARQSNTRGTTEGNQREGSLVRKFGLNRTFVHLVLLAGCVFLVYFGMWRAYFATLDDFGITGWVRSRASLWVAIQGYGSGVRFLNYVPIWFKSQAFGLDAAPYLWSGLAQYVVVVWLVYALAWQLFARRGLALLGALLFAAIYSHYEVVTYVSASDYTFWACFYLATVILFLRYLATGSRLAFLGAIGIYTILAFGHDFTLSMPLVLLAAHLVLYERYDRWRALTGAERITAGWQLIRPHLLIWLLWATHVTLQFTLVTIGTSEAVYSDIGYAPGLHMVTNLRYLIFLLLPNVTIGPIYSFLSEQLAVSVVDGIWQTLMGLGVLLQLFLLWQFRRGPAAIRAAIALIYLPFLQYTPWQGHFIEAPRYLLLPSVGWAILLAWLLMALIDGQHLRAGGKWRVPFAALIVMLFLLANTAVIQIWIRQHIENGHFRRAVVTALHNDYYDVLGPDAYVWIEVPEEKYTDLADSCRLVFDRYFVRCLTYVAGGTPPSTAAEIPADHRFYWLQATAEGIIQLFPEE